MHLEQGTVGRSVHRVDGTGTVAIPTHDDHVVLIGLALKY